MFWRKKGSAPGSEAAQDKRFLTSKKNDLLEKFCPSNEAARDKWFLQKHFIFWTKFCPRQRSCPEQVASSKKTDFLEEVLPQAAKLPGASGLSKKKSDF